MGILYRIILWMRILERILEIEQIVDEDGTTIKLKILRGEN